MYATARSNRGASQRQTSAAKVPTRTFRSDAARGVAAQQVTRRETIHVKTAGPPRLQQATVKREEKSKGDRALMTQNSKLDCGAAGTRVDRSTRLPTRETTGNANGDRKDVDGHKVPTPKSKYLPKPTQPETKPSASCSGAKSKDKRTSAPTPALKDRRASLSCADAEPPTSAATMALNKFFKESVSLKSDAITKNSEKLNKTVTEILTLVEQRDKRFAFTILNTGSYYEGLKVLKPSEFDVMLVFKSRTVGPFFRVNCPSRGNHVGYAQLIFEDHKQGGRGLWGEFLTSDGKYLSPFKIQTYFSQLLQIVVSHRADVRLVKQPCGPAVTIKIDKEISVDLVISVEVPGWPACANAWGIFVSRESWPREEDVRHLKHGPNRKYHLVAKPCKGFGCRTVERGCQTYWRLSFSEAEKFLIRPKADCEKKCYRIVKAIFQLHEAYLKPPLCSYYLKTLFLHRRKNPRRTMTTASLHDDAVGFLQDLVNRLSKPSQPRKPRLPHFFIERVDLLGNIPREELQKAAMILTEITEKLCYTPDEFLQTLRVS